MKFERVTQNVFLVGSDQLSGPGDCLVYAIRVSDEETCLVDAGTSHAGKIIQNIASVPLPARITHLVLTHCHYDHVGAAHQFKEMQPEIHACAHELDVPAIEGAQGTEGMTAASWYRATYSPVKVDIVFRKEREELLVGGVKMEIFHVPGHTPGSIAVVMEDENKRILFGQDIHGPFMKAFKSSKKDWAASMQKLLALEADILCEGHYGVYRGLDNVRSFIEGFLEQEAW